MRRKREQSLFAVLFWICVGVVVVNAYLAVEQVSWQPLMWATVFALLALSTPESDT